MAPGHAGACRAGEEFAVYPKLTRRHWRVWDGRDVIQFVFQKTALAVVYERSWVVRGQEKLGEQLGGQGCHPGYQDGA